MHKVYILLVVLSVFLMFRVEKVSAQTFGPICDTTTPETTCVPTIPPTTTQPTSTPPVSGTTEITLALLGLSGIFVIGSIVSYTKAFSSSK